MKTPNPKPCPCCGPQTDINAVPRLIDQGHINSCAGRRSDYYVKCLNCGLMTAIYPTAAEAIEAWNRRDNNG